MMCEPVNEEERDMPELPEVENVKRILSPQLTGRRITGVNAIWPGVIAYPSPEEFSRAAVGAQITGMERRGKFLTIRLGDGGCIRLHLRMTGALLAAPADYPVEKYTHLRISLDDGSELRFSDMRRFGRFWLFRAGETDTVSGIERLGPEPLPALTADELCALLGSRKKPIKECLLDQAMIAGIGNIHGDEILYLAGISPKRPASSLDGKEWLRLSEAIPAELAAAIGHLAMTPEEYLAGGGKEYRDEPYLAVYGHAGEPCPRCGTVIEKTVLAGRGSCYCPNCQR